MYGSASSTNCTRVSDDATVSLPHGRSNPDLDAERSLNLEMGWRFHSDRLRVGVSVFRDKYSNFIDTAQYLADEGVQYRNSCGKISNGSYGWMCSAAASDSAP